MESLNGSLDPGWQPELQATDVLTLLVQPMVIVFVVVSNAVFLLTIARTPELRTVSSVFLGSLLVADLLIAAVMPVRLALSLPRFHQAIQQNRWLCLGKLACLFIPLFAHFYSMVVMAVDRCLFIGRPLRYRRLVTPARAGATTLLTWCLALAAGSVPLYSHAWSPGQCHCDRVFAPWFRLLVLLPSFSLACLAVAAASLYVFCVARRHLQAIRRSQAGSRLHGGSRTRGTQPLLALPTSRCVRRCLRRLKAQLKKAVGGSAPGSEDTAADGGGRPPANPEDVHVSFHKTGAPSESHDQVCKEAAVDTEAKSLVSPHAPSDSDLPGSSAAQHCAELSPHCTPVTSRLLEPESTALDPAPSSGGARDGRRGVARLYLLVFGTFFACWAPTLGCLVVAQVGGLPLWGEQPWNALALLNTFLNVLLNVSLHKKLRGALLAWLRGAKRAR